MMPDSACRAFDVIMPSNLPLVPETIIPPLSPRYTEALVCTIIGCALKGVTFATDPTETVADRFDCGSNKAWPMATAEDP